MIECHIVLDNNYICDFITSFARLTTLDWVLDKSEYLIFSCIRLNNEHPLSSVDLREGGVNVETSGLLDAEMLSILRMLSCSLLYYILTYWLSADVGNITSIPIPSGNPLFPIKYLLVQV